MCKEDFIKIVFVISSSHTKPNLSTNGDSFDGFAEAKMAPAVADLKAMTDAFEGIDKLAEGAPRTDGAPNFRRVNTNTLYRYRYSPESCWVITTLIKLWLT